MRDTFQIFPLFPPHFAHFSMMNIEQETHAVATPRCSAVEKTYAKSSILFSLSIIVSRFNLSPIRLPFFVVVALFPAPREQIDDDRQIF